MDIDRVDGRNRAAIDGEKRAVQGVQQTLLVRIAEGWYDLEVEPRAKGLALAGNDDAADVGVTSKASVICSASSMLIAFAGGLCKATVATGPILARGDPGQLSVL